MQIILLCSEEFEKRKTEMKKLIKETIISNFRNSNPREEYYEDTLESLKNHLNNNTAIVFMAIDKEQLVGWAWCHEIYRFEKRRLHIANFAVVSACRNHGIGAEIFHFIEEYAKKYDFDGLDLLVTVSNEPAINFYIKHGFQTERLLLKRDLKNDC